MIVLLVLRPAYAQSEQVTVRLDGRAVFRVGAVEELDATARARQIERRMNRLLENPEAIAPPRIEATSANNTDRVITIAGVPLVTITEAELLSPKLTLKTI